MRSGWISGVVDDLILGRSSLFAHSEHENVSPTYADPNDGSRVSCTMSNLCHTSKYDHGTLTLGDSMKSRSAVSEGKLIDAFG